MDPAIISAVATSAVSALKLFFTKGGEEIAKSAFKDAYQSVKARLIRNPKSRKAIDYFEANPEEGAPELESALSEHLISDKELFIKLTESLEKSGMLKSHPLAEKIIAEKVVIAKNIKKVVM